MPRVEPLPALTATSPGVPFTWLTVALLAMASAGQIEISMAPFILSMIVDHYRVSETVGLFVIGLQLGGFALTALLVSGWVGRSRRGGMKHARLAVGLGLLSQLVSLLPVGVSVLAIARLTAGVAEGATVAIAYAIISRMENFSRMLAIQGGVMAAGVVGMLLLVPLADAEFGPVGLFVPLMMVAALTLPLTFALPTDHEAVTRAEHKGPVSRGIAVVALVAVSLSAASNTLWLFMDQIGTRDGLSLSAISRVTALSAASCVAAPYFAYHSRRLSGSIAPIILLCIVQAGFGWFFTHTRSSAIYVVTSFGLNLTYAWCMVSVRIASADYDATGRAPSAVAGAESFGLVIGPLLAGLATSIWPGYATIGILAGAGFAVAGMAVVWFGRIGSFR
jgi:predicted MFS family arabinose efflux permease